MRLARPQTSLVVHLADRLAQRIDPSPDGRPAVNGCGDLNRSMPHLRIDNVKGTSWAMARVPKVRRSQCVVAPARRSGGVAGRFDAHTAHTARASQSLTCSYSA